MKFALAILAVLAMASPLTAFKLPASGSGALAKELQDFVDLVPFDKVISIIKAYATQDKEFQAAMKVLDSDELKQFVAYAEAIPAVKTLLNHLEQAGLDIISLINKLNDVLGLAHISSLQASEYKISGGLLGFGDDLASVIPVEEISQLAEKKRKTSQVFNDFIHELLKPELVKVYLSLNSNPHYVKLAQEATQANIDTETFAAYFPVLMMSKTILALHKP
ncbi:protein G12-like [Andrena cerasifolii]|uniref:protein G12-like n=1 Tax=Andrena cerasifolii TaxID=2819439 RepID=UPI0040381F30